MSLKRILGLVLLAGLMFPLAACDDTKTVAPPPPPKQITTHRHYQKAAEKLDDGTTVQIGLQSNDVHDVLLVSDGALWVGNQEGIAVYGNPASTRRTADFDPNNGLPNPKVRELVESDGFIYAGTWGGGLGVYDMTAGTWSTLNTDDGLVNNLISDLAVDDDGAIIIATNDGVSRYNPADGTFTNYKKSLSKSVVGDLLDGFVSSLEIARTPRGKEYWYMPRWESGILPENRGDHGITVARGLFNAPAKIETLQVAMDNTIYENVDGMLSNGAGQYLLVGKDSDGLLRRALMKFDVYGKLPLDAVVQSVRLRFRNTSAGIARSQVSVHRVLSAWGEGTSDADGNEQAGAPATTGDATWKHTFYPNSDWDTPGGDYAPTASGGIEVRSLASLTLTTKEMAADVQMWVRDTSPNHGWILVTPDTIKALCSRSFATASFRPTLAVTYSRYGYATVLNSALPEPNVNDIYYDELNDLFYIAFATRGLAVVDPVTPRWTLLTTDDGLPSNVVYSVTQVGGVIWVGTQNGLARQLGNGSFQGYSRGGGLPGDRVRRVRSDRPDRLWVGLVSAGAAWVLPESAQ